MSGLITKETNRDVMKYIESIEHKGKREDSRWLVELMQEVTGSEPRIWGDNFIIGFGKYKYKRKGGKEEFEWFNMGFAPRKTNITLYLACDLSKLEQELKKLGKCKHGKGCLYINKLDDVDLKTLRKLIVKSKETRWGD